MDLVCLALRADRQARGVPSAHECVGSGFQQVGSVLRSSFCIYVSFFVSFYASMSIHVLPPNSAISLDSGDKLITDMVNKFVVAIWFPMAKGHVICIGRIIAEFHGRVALVVE